MDNMRNYFDAFANHDDQKAFRGFFDFYYPKLFRFALYLMKSEMLAEEVVSDVFIKVWNNRKRLVIIERMDFYLFRSVKNQALNYLRKKSTEFEQIDEIPESSLMTPIDPEKELLQKELKVKVDEAIGQLPPKCRLIFEMTRDNGLQYHEVADILDISKSTVKNQMTIALKKIRNNLTNYIDVKDYALGSMAFLMFLFF